MSKKAKISDIAVEEKPQRGRPKSISTPELMWNLFNDYVDKVKSTPFEITDWVGKDADQVIRTKEKPLTMVGFEKHCYSEGYTEDLSRYFANTDNAYSDFSAIARHIRNCIKDDQISGGMVGIYNSTLTASLNNLSKKIETRDIDKDGNDKTSILVRMIEAAQGVHLKKEGED